MTLLQKLPLFKEELAEAIELGSRSVCCWCFVKHVGAERCERSQGSGPFSGAGLCLCLVGWLLTPVEGSTLQELFCRHDNTFLFHPASWFQFQIFLMHLSFPGKSDKMQREVGAETV